MPTVVTGSIPPNKSDLKVFGVYQEGSTATGFLHLFWTRVQDPTGTTNMDFELNQVRTKSSNNVTPVRTKGDFLLQYDLANGGTSPELFVSRWRTAGADGSCQASNSYPCWGTRVDLSSSGDAAGSINTSAIPFAEADGVNGTSGLSARTFGEASVRLSALIGTGTCTTIGSAYLKSRSSDSFTAAVYDFVPPANVSITNCGTVNIVKQDDAGNPLNGATFTLYTDATPVGGTRGDEDTATSFTCDTAGTGSAAGKCSITNVPFGDYWVVETTTPAGYGTAADQHATISAAVSSVTLTFQDPRLFKVIVLVCKQSDSSLWSSNVTLSPDTKASLASSSSPSPATLCGLGGASFGDLQTGTKSLSVNIGTTPVP